MPDNLPDLLQQLRDIHEPALPGWWPMAYGWWILLVLIACALILMAWFYWGHNRRMKPYRYIRSQALSLIDAYESKRLNDIQFQDHVNELFKRLLIRVENQPYLYPVHGIRWLEELQLRFNEPAFVQGAGQSLGDARFMRAQIHSPEFVHLVKKTLGTVEPPKRKRR